MLHWIDAALCGHADPEQFFPKQRRRTAAAEAICAACPVAVDCLAYAMSQRTLAGIWGGTTAAERTALRRLATSDVSPCIAESLYAGRRSETASDGPGS